MKIDRGIAGWGTFPDHRISSVHMTYGTKKPILKRQIFRSKWWWDTWRCGLRRTIEIQGLMKLLRSAQLMVWSRHFPELHIILHLQDTKGDIAEIEINLIIVLLQYYWSSKCSGNKLFLNFSGRRSILRTWRCFSGDERAGMTREEILKVLIQEVWNSEDSDLARFATMHLQNLCVLLKNFHTGKL